MNIRRTLGLAAAGIVLVTTTNRAQTTPTTPTGTATSTTYPQGAVAPDSMPAKLSRAQKRTMRQNRKMSNQNSKANAGSTANTSTQDARYRQSSSSNGTTINNSNSTNYNSNNATNAPTGVGSNPNTATTPATGTSPAPATPPNPGSDSPASDAANANAGSKAAVSGAKMTETPAVTSGSTVRNTSVGDFIASSPNYITLQNALQSADLHETLRGTGPYTLFAPTNSAFKKLPAATQAGLLEGRNRETLKQLLSYHVVSGSLSADQLTKQIKDGNGKAQLKTLAGGMITLQLDPNGRLQLTDEQGGTVSVEATENRQMNGMVYGLDTILMPKMGANLFR